MGFPSWLCALAAVPGLPGRAGSVPQPTWVSPPGLAVPGLALAVPCLRPLLVSPLLSSPLVPSGSRCDVPLELSLCRVSEVNDVHLELHICVMQ